ARRRRRAFLARKTRPKPSTPSGAPGHCPSHAGCSPWLFLMWEKLQQWTSSAFTGQLRTLQIRNCCETSWIITRNKRMSVEKLLNGLSKPASLNLRKAKVTRTASSPKSDQLLHRASFRSLPRRQEKGFCDECGNLGFGQRAKRFP